MERNDFTSLSQDESPLLIKCQHPLIHDSTKGKKNDFLIFKVSNASLENVIFNPVCHLATRTQDKVPFLEIPLIFLVRCCHSRTAFPNPIVNEATPDQTQRVAGLTQASVVGKQLDESLAVGLAVAAAAAVAPRRQAEASRPHVVGCHHRTYGRETESRSGGGGGRGCHGSNIPGGRSCRQCLLSLV